MVVVFLCIYCAKIVDDNKLFPARKRLTLHACTVDSFRHQHFWNGGDFCLIFSIYQTKFDAKMTKSKWNYSANMIMSVSGTVCQRIHYFPSKQWLAIDPTWPALKVNNARGIDIISWSFFFFEGNELRWHTRYKHVGYVYYGFVHPRYNSLGDPTRQHGVWRKILLNTN